MQNSKLSLLFAPLKTNKSTKPVWLGFIMSQQVGGSASVNGGNTRIVIATAKRSRSRKQSLKPRLLRRYRSSQRRSASKN